MSNSFKIANEIFNNHKNSINFGHISLEDDKYETCPPSEQLKISGKVYISKPSKKQISGNISISGENSTVFIGKDTQVKDINIKIKGKNSFVLIGEGCRLGKVTMSLPRDNCIIVLGSNSSFESGVCICDGEAIMIGKGAMISNGVLMRTSDGHGIFDLDSGELLNPPMAIYINEYVWLGNASRINKGVEIGKHTVLGGASVASGNLNSNCIYAGIPARKIKSNIAWSRTYSYDDIKFN